MEFKKIEPRRSGAALQRSEMLSVLVQPLAGHSAEEVESALRENGAEFVSVLAPGLLSARAGESCLRAVESIARVQVKAPSQLRVHD